MLDEAKDDTGGKCLQEGRVGGTCSCLPTKVRVWHEQVYSNNGPDLSSAALARSQGGSWPSQKHH